MTRDSRKEKEGVSRSVVSDSFATRGLEPTRLLSVEFSRQGYWSGWPFSFSRGPSQLRGGARVSCTVGRLFIV